MGFETNKRIESVELKVTAEKALTKRNHEYEELTRFYNAQRDTLKEQDKIIHDLLERYNVECINATITNGNVTNIVILDAHREHLPLQEISGYDMNNVIQFMQTPLYQGNEGLQFVYIENRILKINKIKYNKFLGGIL